MVFFDIMFIGRILNRFLKDFDEFDIYLLFNIDLVFLNIVCILILIGMIVVVFLWFLIGLVLLIVIFGLINCVFNCLFCQFKCMDGIICLFIYLYLIVMVQGFFILYVYNKMVDFNVVLKEYLDKNIWLFFMFFCVQCWLVVCLDLLIICIVIIVGFMVVFIKGIFFLVFFGFVLIYFIRVRKLKVM